MDPGGLAGRILRFQIPSDRIYRATRTTPRRTHRGLVLGVANKRSLAWGCARSLADAGMRLAFTYANERMEGAVRKLAGELEGSLVLPCDVTKPDEIDEVFRVLGEEFGSLDGVVHAIAFARREELQGNFFDTTKDGYMLAHEVSAYSLTAVARRAVKLMEGREGSITTLTYIGADRVIPNYNVMASPRQPWRLPYATWRRISGHGAFGSTPSARVRFEPCPRAV